MYVMRHFFDVIVFDRFASESKCRLVKRLYKESYLQVSIFFKNVPSRVA